MNRPSTLISAGLVLRDRRVILMVPTVIDYLLLVEDLAPDSGSIDAQPSIRVAWLRLALSGLGL